MKINGIFRALGSLLSLERSAGNIAALDGLRGIAILLVLGRHAVRPFYGEDGLLSLGGWEASSPFINGWIGVDLFFVLSGFLITYQMLRRRARRGAFQLGDYLTRRIFRIVPTYVAVLALVVGGLIPLYSPDISTADVVVHAIFLQDYTGSRIVPAFWSLGVEEKFYLLAPLLLAGVLMLRHYGWQMAALGILLAVSLSFRTITFFLNDDVASYDQAFFIFRSPFHLNLDGLVLGMALALTYDAVQQGRFAVSEQAARLVFWAGTALIGLLLFLQPLMDRPSWFNATLLASLVAAGFASVAFGLLFNRRLFPSFFGSLPLYFAAKVSYPLYLIHMALIPVTLSALNAAVGLDVMAPALGFVIFLPFFVAVSVMAALYLHVAVERPFLMIRDRLLSEPRPEVASPEAAAVASAPDLARI